MVTQSKIENPKLPLLKPESGTPNLPSFTVLGVRVDAVQIPDVIELMAAMGHAARAEYEAKYTAERNYQMLMEIYQRVLGARGSVLGAGGSGGSGTQ
jgi:hypothetical protein